MELCNADGLPPLSLCAKMGTVSTAKVLVKAGCKLDAVDALGRYFNRMSLCNSCAVSCHVFRLYLFCLVTIR